MISSFLKNDTEMTIFAEYDEQGEVIMGEKTSEKSKNFMKKENGIQPYQGMRLAACLCIILLHCYSSRFDRAAAWGVGFFFSVSGFLYGLRFRERDLPVTETWLFFLKKLKKIYPIFLLTNLLALPYELIVKPAGTALAELGVTLSLVQAWSPRLSDLYLGSTWFISTVLFLYLLTPLLVTCLKGIQHRFGNAGLSAAAMLFLTACFVITVLAGNAKEDPTFWIYTFPPSRFPEYAFFLTVGLLIPQETSLLKDEKGLLTDIGYLTVSIVLLFVFFRLQIPRLFSRVVLWIFPNLVLLLLGLRGSGVVNRALSAKVPVYLGNLGLSLYLFHPVVFVYTTFWNDFWDSRRILRVLCFVGILALTVLLSVFTEQVSQKIRSSAGKAK